MVHCMYHCMNVAIIMLNLTNKQITDSLACLPFLTEFSNFRGGRHEPGFVLKSKNCQLCVQVNQCVVSCTCVKRRQLKHLCKYDGRNGDLFLSWSDL